MSVQSPPRVALGPRVFLSYRRHDTLPIIGRIYDRLVDSLGPESVFMDFDSIPLGVDYRKHLEMSLEQCDILLAIIGSNWLSGGQGPSVNRLLSQTDLVRMEIETALRLNIPVIPVLVGSASLPSPADLPPQLESLVYRQAATVDVARDFHTHMSRLIDALVEIGPRLAPPSALDVGETTRRSLAENRAEQGHIPPTRPEGRPTFRALLETTRAPAWRAFLLWGVMGAMLGVVTSFALDLGPDWASRMAPGFIFAIGILLVDEIAGGERLSRRFPRFLAYGVTLAASVNAIVIVGRLNEDIGTSELYRTAAGGVLGAVLLAIPILWMWQAGRSTWKIAPLSVAVGGVLGSLFPFAFSAFSPRVLAAYAIWQAGVLAAFAATPVIDRTERAA